MRLICARSRRRPRWHKVVKFKTVVGDHIREAGRAIMSGDERKKKWGDSGWQRQMARTSKKLNVVKTGEEELRNMIDVIPNKLTQEITESKMLL